MIKDVISRLQRPDIQELPIPIFHPNFSEGGYKSYTGVSGSEVKVGLAVSSMSYHTTDEGYQLFAGLRDSANYELWGHDFHRRSSTDVAWIIEYLQLMNKRQCPSVVLLQDKREWDLHARDFRDPLAKFTNVDYLKNRDDIFKLTILKDAQQRPSYHRESADEIGCHAWVIYYDPRIVHHLAPYTRRSHLLRTYHTIDPQTVPPYSPLHRSPCLLSGAVSGAYPLRSRLVRDQHLIPEMTVLPHPGYHRNGSHTPQFMKILSQYKVAICTSSMYGYALRKIMEATACGCRVITDLPVDEVLPCIDDNLVRVDPGIFITKLRKLLLELTNTYDPSLQEYYARQAISQYDYKYQAALLDRKIQNLMVTYPEPRVNQ